MSDTIQKRHLLVDGDIVAYKIAASCEEAVHWGDDMWTLHSDAGEGKIQVDYHLEMLRQELHADNLTVFLSSRGQFRKDFFPEYKANRIGVRKPLILNALKEHMVSEWGALLEDRLEADDYIGIEATTPDESFERIIVSVDKDFKGVPCKLYNPDRADEGVLTIDEQQADYNHLFQTLVGDSSDNYSGCPKVGPKTAEKVLGEERDLAAMWEIVLKTFDKGGLSSKHALIQARVARILRKGEYDFDTKQIKLWTPPKKL